MNMESSSFANTWFLFRSGAFLRTSEDEGYNEFFSIIFVDAGESKCFRMDLPGCML